MLWQKMIKIMNMYIHRYVYIYYVGKCKKKKKEEEKKKEEM